MSWELMSWEQWETTYRPTTEWMADFYDDIKDTAPSPQHVWTVVDNNPNSRYLDVIPGLRAFNRLGFFVTEVPWTNVDLTVSNDPTYKEGVA